VPSEPTLSSICGAIEEESMERHIKVARAHRAVAWLYGLITLMTVGFLVIVLVQGAV
jgi:hypothetical protein